MRSPGSTSKTGGVSWASLSLRQSGGADRGEKGGLHFSLLTVWIALHAVGGRGRKALTGQSLLRQAGEQAPRKQTERMLDWGPASAKLSRISACLLNLQLSSELAMLGYELSPGVVSPWETQILRFSFQWAPLDCWAPAIVMSGGPEATFQLGESSCTGIHGERKPYGLG